MPASEEAVKALGLKKGIKLTAAQLERAVIIQSLVISPWSPVLGNSSRASGRACKAEIRTRTRTTGKTTSIPQDDD